MLVYTIGLDILEHLSINYPLLLCHLSLNIYSNKITDLHFTLEAGVIDEISSLLGNCSHEKNIRNQFADGENKTNDINLNNIRKIPFLKVNKQLNNEMSETTTMK